MATLAITPLLYFKLFLPRYPACPHCLYCFNLPCLMLPLALLLITTLSLSSFQSTQSPFLLPLSWIYLLQSQMDTSGVSGGLGKQLASSLVKACSHLILHLQVLDTIQLGINSQRSLHRAHSLFGLMAQKLCHKGPLDNGWSEAQGERHWNATAQNIYSCELQGDWLHRVGESCH